MERRVVIVRGLVQGVGFRPYVYGLAWRLNLGGFVRNRSGAVQIEVEGSTDSLDRFLQELTDQPPPLARIEQVSWEKRAAISDGPFRIASSRADRSSIFVMSDMAVCDACLAELFDPADRRRRYPFINCTHCGPRLTIISGGPYDRRRTTMAAFVMCRACRAEYDDPGNRRFHAQANACPDCGPRLRATDGDGRQIETDDPIAWFAAAIRDGQIGALKGLGGYHLACDARNASAVAELRRRKHREEKPLAVMLTDTDVTALCEASSEELRLLRSPRRPIVLLSNGRSITDVVFAPSPCPLPKGERGQWTVIDRPLLRKRDSIALAEEVAAGNPLVGVMLPYTPLHHLLLHELEGTPLVMTSGNASEEPIAYEDDDAFARLRGIADVFLVHNRPIHVRCDDSVTRVIAGEELPLRRSRGYAPEPIVLPWSCRRPILAVGGQLKATFALGRGRHAFLSHHLGDLDHRPAYQAFERDVSLYEQLFSVRPEQIVCDLHPDYASTRYAVDRAKREGVAILAVQHHHAHLASCLAEHGLQEPAIGVIWDGTGCGTDGAVWGGEFLVGDCRRFRRAAHFRYVGMPGGEQAVREPWRMAAAHLADASADCEAFAARIPERDRRMTATMLRRRINSPLTSSAGRLFDAVAALAGVRDRVAYEGQAAMELEWLAAALPPDEAYPWKLSRECSEDALLSSWTVDTRPLIRAVAVDSSRGINRRHIARRFHATLVEIIVSVCKNIRESAGLDAVVLSGGVFMNALLTGEAVDRLRQEQFRVYRHRLVPPNDGGLSLGQLAVAAAHLL